MKFANILFQQKTGNDNDVLTYAIPEDMPISEGHNVTVPLRNRPSYGIVWELHNNKPEFKTMNIKEINYEQPLLTKDQIKLAKWMSEYYFCSPAKILKLFVPDRVLKNKPFRMGEAQEEQIIRSRTKELTKDQENAIETVTTSQKNKFLIHGVTGSGKTEIYTQLAQKYIDQNKQVLILVPEISLTPQIIEYFEKAIGIKAAVIHSKISEGQRCKNWLRIHKNEAKLIIGSRSAAFAPIQDPGLIIMDEEHENSYKQDNAPRYSVHKVLDKMLELNPKLKVVFGSATPSIEATELLKDTTIRINDRIGTSTLPDIEVVDLRDEFKKKNFSIFSDRLKEEITQALKNKQQIILFLNRRGAASSVVCRDCGHIEKCKACETTLTFHKTTLQRESLICHHCGKIATPPSTCPNCQGVNIRYLGIGTQRIEQEIHKDFPEARTLRADKDTTSGKYDFEKIYKAFKNHEADILIGTQMIAKGLHLPKVHLVGVVLADIGLNIPDFRASERNFQLMTQVAGRAGRSKDKGKVIIQSYNPEHQALISTKEQNYDNFFNYERTQRKILNNPPFSRLAKILIEDKSQSKAKETAENLEKQLWQIARQTNTTEQMEINYYPAYLSRLRNKYRFIVLIKSKDPAISPHNLLEKLNKEDIIATNIKIDIDPIQIT